MFRVQAHVFNRDADKGTGLQGRLTFTSRNYKLANAVASNVQFDESFTANIDFDMNVRVGHRSVWVECNPHCLEAAAETLMQAASDIRHDRKAKTNGKGHDLTTDDYRQA